MCMMCWVNYFFVFFLYSCVICLFTVVYMTLVRDYCASVHYQHFIWESGHPHVGCFKSPIVLFPLCCLRCTECGCQSSLSALFRSESEKFEPNFNLVRKWMCWSVAFSFFKHAYHSTSLWTDNQSPWLAHTSLSYLYLPLFWNYCLHNHSSNTHSEWLFC